MQHSNSETQLLPPITKYKVTLVGDAGTNKEYLISRLLPNTNLYSVPNLFSPQKTKQKTFTLGDENIRVRLELQAVDGGGNTNYKHTFIQYNFANQKLFLLCFDPAIEDSLLNLREYFETLSIPPEGQKLKKPVCFLLVEINLRSNTKRVITETQAKAFAKELKIDYFAFKEDNIPQTCKAIAHYLYKFNQNNAPRLTNSNETNNQEVEERSCCRIM